MPTSSIRDATAPALERYSVGDQIGQGMSADVYKVTEIATGRDFVLKQTLFNEKDEAECGRLLEEIAAMVDVDHVNIVRFHESFRGVRSVNIVMERCESTLEDLIEKQKLEGRPFPPDVLIEWMAELLCGLEYLHSRRIIHRDIKTTNIFVSKKYHLKLGDFGVCKMLTQTTGLADSIIGTPLYFAPEVCNEETYDERSDIWSLGIVFYEMCTLRHPFEADNLFALMYKIQRERPPPFNTGLDPRFESIVFNMLAKKPHERPLAKLLIRDHLDVPETHPSHPSQTPARGRAIQQYFGPQLVFTRDEEREEFLSTPPATGKNSQHGTREASAPASGTAAPVNEADVPPPRHKKGGGKPQQKHSQQCESAPSPDEVRKKHIAPVSAGPSPASPLRNGWERATKSSSSKSQPIGRVLTEEERNESILRVKTAKSKINVSELRKEMLTRRKTVMSTSDNGDDVPVVIHLQSGLRSALREEDKGEGSMSIESVKSKAASQGSNSASQIRTQAVKKVPSDASMSCSKSAAPPPQSFSDEVSAVLARLARSDKPIPLEDLEKTVELIQQYKTDHYGWY